MNHSEREEQRARIAGWVKEGKDATKARKERNHALILLGVAALKSVTEGERDLIDFLRHIEDGKHDLIRDVVERESPPK